VQKIALLLLISFVKLKHLISLALEDHKKVFSIIPKKKVKIYNIFLALK
jgi:hypothetical protein